MNVKQSPTLKIMRRGCAFADTCCGWNIKFSLPLELGESKYTAHVSFIKHYQYHIVIYVRVKSQNTYSDCIIIKMRTFVQYNIQDLKAI